MEGDRELDRYAKYEQELAQARHIRRKRALRQSIAEEQISIRQRQHARRTVRLSNSLITSGAVVLNALGIENLASQPWVSGLLITFDSVTVVATLIAIRIASQYLVDINEHQNMEVFLKGQLAGELEMSADSTPEQSPTSPTNDNPNL